MDVAVVVTFGVDGGGGSGRGQPLLSHWLHVQFICSSKARCADPQDSVWTWIHSSLALAPLHHHSANSLTSLSWVLEAPGSVPVPGGTAAASEAPPLQLPQGPAELSKHPVQ